MAELCWTPAADLARMIAEKEVSPVEVVRAHLDRVAALDGKLRAFITVCAEPALEAARAAEARVLAGDPLGPLHGVPYGPKDLYATKGIRTTGGSTILGDFVPEADATVVARLAAAGMIVLGKLNMHEFAYGPEGLNGHYGDVWNPWDAGTHRVAGGSSSGSAAAVAAAAVLVGNRGIRSVVMNFLQLRNVDAQIKALDREEKALRERIETLRSDDDALESAARKELGMRKLGEIEYRFPPPGPEDE